MAVAVDETRPASAGVALCPCGCRRKATPDPVDLMTIAQVACYLGVNHPEQVRQVIRKGLMRASRIGEQGPNAPYRVLFAWVLEYINAGATVGPESEKPKVPAKPRRRTSRRVPKVDATPAA